MKINIYNKDMSEIKATTPATNVNTSTSTTTNADTNTNTILSEWCYNYSDDIIYNTSVKSSYYRINNNYRINININICPYC